MNQNITIELQLRPAGTAGDDTAGYVMEAGKHDRVAIALPAIRLTPVVIRGFNPQPDPPLTAETLDVRGFMPNDYSEVGPNENIGNGQSSPGSTWGWVPIVAGFVSDPAGTVFGHFFNSFKS